MNEVNETFDGGQYSASRELRVYRADAVLSCRGVQWFLWVRWGVMMGKRRTFVSRIGTTVHRGRKASPKLNLGT